MQQTIQGRFEDSVGIGKWEACVTFQYQHSNATSLFVSPSVVCISEPNACRNRAATKDCPFQNRPTSPLQRSLRFFVSIPASGVGRSNFRIGVPAAINNIIRHQPIVKFEGPIPIRKTPRILHRFFAPFSLCTVRFLCSLRNRRRTLQAYEATDASCVGNERSLRSL